MATKSDMCGGPEERPINVGPSPDEPHLSELHSGLYRPQPEPSGQGTPILPLVISDLTERQEHGRKKYGTVLRAQNGRSSLRDAKEEAYDLAMYLRQFEEDLPALLARTRAEALAEVVEALEDLLGPAGTIPQPGPDTTPDELAAFQFANGIRRAVSAVKQIQDRPGDLAALERSEMEGP